MRRFSSPAVPKSCGCRKEFRFDVDQVEVTREGDAVILRPPVGHRPRWASLRAALEHGFSDDFMADGRQQPEDQIRSRPERNDDSI